MLIIKRSEARWPPGRFRGLRGSCVLCRYKQAFQQPGAPTAAINYYRALIDCATWWVTDHPKYLPFNLPLSRT